jgi:hypothetical protein
VSLLNLLPAGDVAPFGVGVCRPADELLLEQSPDTSHPGYLIYLRRKCDVFNCQSERVNNYDLLRAPAAGAPTYYYVAQFTVYLARLRVYCSVLRAGNEPFETLICE